MGERVSPAVTAAVGMRLFLRVGRRHRIDPRDASIMSVAQQSEIALSGATGRGAVAVVYEWEGGPDIVVLLHGWQGRASQFGPLVRELRAEGFTVVAIDAPAHGSAPGRRAYLPDWIEALQEVQKRAGGFHAVVGHSFGGLAAALAATGGVQTRRLVTVSAPSAASVLFSQFRSQLGYGNRVDQALRARFERTVLGAGGSISDFDVASRGPDPTLDALVVHDRRDRRVPFEQAEVLRAALSAEAVHVSGAGHSGILRSEECLDAVPAFLIRPDRASAHDAHSARGEPGAAV